MTSKDDKWILAFSDPLATLYTFPSCVAMADLSGDGDHKLIIADLGTGKYNMKLKVYKGVTLYNESALVDLPTAVATFVMDQVQPTCPAVAVASGSSVYVYKNLKPYYKFNLPSADVNETEREVWQHSQRGNLDARSLADVLDSLRDQFTFASLTTQSQRFLLLDEGAARDEFVATYQNEALKKQSVVTALTTMKKASQEANAIDCLVVGCENGRVLLVDAEAFTVLAECLLPAEPVVLHASGLYDVEYRILACCRNGSVYTIKRGLARVERPTIELSSHAVDMVRVGKHVMIACVDHTLRTYSVKGRKMASMRMPCAITAIAQMDYAPKNYAGTLVALENKQIHLYKDQFLVDLITLDDVATSLKFGQFGREEGALVVCTRGGGLAIRLFKRTAKLEERSNLPGPPAAQSQKLNVPRKTKIFVDQTIRERDEAQRMHQVFQRDLFMLRLQTAQAYSQMLESNLNPISLNPEDMLKLSAQLQGFGPVFLMLIYLQTMSVQAVEDLSITFHYNPKLYSFEKNDIVVPMLVPGIQYGFQSKVFCLAPEKGLSDDIKVLIVRGGQSAPVMTAVVTMPVSEQSLVD